MLLIGDHDVMSIGYILFIVDHGVMSIGYTLLWTMV